MISNRHGYHFLFSSSSSFSFFSFFFVFLRVFVSSCRKHAQASAVGHASLNTHFLTTAESSGVSLPSSAKAFTCSVVNQRQRSVNGSLGG